ncbi:K+-sensing histidine kinase KdpD [Catenulispora sp. MAP12-49]
MLVARIGGLFTSVTASLLLNYYFIPPFYRLTIAAGNNLIALDD